MSRLCPQEGKGSEVSLKRLVLPLQARQKTQPVLTVDTHP